MRQSALVVCLLGLVTLLSPVPATAQATRTWVSGTGNDGNPCSRALPCLTFAAAFATTTTGGEINVLDPGGFGSVIINRSVSIYNDGVGEAGIVVSGTNAIVINAGATDVINLRGLTLNGQGGSLGVHILAAGRVSIQNCVIQQFGTGVNVATGADVRLKIQDTTIINNTNGVTVQPGGGIANVSIEHSRMDSNNGFGFKATGAFGGGTRVVMSHSSASLNGNVGIVVEGVSGVSVAHINDSVAAGNAANGISVKQAGAIINRTSSQNNSGNGILADSGAVIHLGNSTITGNLFNGLVVSGGQILSYQNNQTKGNSVDTAPSGVLTLN